MPRDYLGLGKDKLDFGLELGPKIKSNPSDPYGLGTFAEKRKREVTEIRRGVKETARAVNQLKQDYNHGGWVGEYIYKKHLQRKANNQAKNIQAFGRNVRNKRMEKS